MVKRLRNAALVVLMGVAGVFAMGTPARAETYNGSCVGNNELSIWLDGGASYTVSGQWQNWYLITGVIRRNQFLPNSNLGSQSNVNLFLYQDGAQNWTSFSPDNIAPGDGWSANPNRSLPEWSNVQARVQGIFDKPLASDPRCDWWTPVV